MWVKAPIDSASSERAVSHTRLRFEVIASVSISFTKVSPDIPYQLSVVMQNRKNPNAPPQQHRQRVKLKAKDSKEKLKTYDKPVAIRKPQSTRRLEHTKDVVGSYRKDKSKSKGGSSKGPAAALPSAPKASQKGSKHGKPPSHKQRKQHSG
ncbi:hypothetical protein GCK32_016299 [Trichostrongylus colubriformis]|uniref:Uncharacterized protein n=1 Tax=Trichostrongylus colubriformis TaxID=6319 RepID=A0AAN8F0J7_TRICO